MCEDQPVGKIWLRVSSCDDYTVVGESLELRRPRTEITRYQLVIKQKLY